MIINQKRERDLIIKILLFIKSGNAKFSCLNDDIIKQNFQDASIDEVESILKELQKGENSFLKKINSELDESDDYELNPKGELYLSRLQEDVANEQVEKNKSEELRQSVLKTNKIQQIILYLTVLVSVVSCFISWCNYKKSTDQRLYVLPISKQDTTIIKGVSLNKNCADSCRKIFNK